jgi:hypothetical protein
VGELSGRDRGGLAGAGTGDRRPAVSRHRPLGAPSPSKIRPKSIETMDGAEGVGARRGRAPTPSWRRVGRPLREIVRPFLAFPRRSRYGGLLLSRDVAPAPPLRSVCAVRQSACFAARRSRGRVSSPSDE